MLNVDEHRIWRKFSDVYFRLILHWHYLHQFLDGTSQVAPRLEGSSVHYPIDGRVFQFRIGALRPVIMYSSSFDFSSFVISGCLK